MIFVWWTGKLKWGEAWALEISASQGYRKQVEVWNAEIHEVFWYEYTVSSTIFEYTNWFAGCVGHRKEHILVQISALI